MEKTLKSAESSDLYRKIDALKLSAVDRAQVLAAIAIAEKLADVMIRIARATGAISTRVSSKPTLKHQ